MTTTDIDTAISLPRDSNQALGIGTFACDFMRGDMGAPSDEVLHRTTMFFTDSVLCGLSALACRTNAPTVLRDEALLYVDDGGACGFGSTQRVKPEKAVAANVVARPPRASADAGSLLEVLRARVVADCP